MSRTATRRSEAAAETRRLILAAAKELYLEKGYRQAPSRELAERAGVAEGTIFAHFPDKASLLAAALDGDIEETLSNALQTLPREGACLDRFLHLARAMYDYYARNPELSKALVKESLFLEGEWGQRVVDTVTGFLSLVAGFVEQARDRGEYRPDIDVDTAARGFFAAYYLELLAGLSLPGLDPAIMARSLEAQLRLWERGLLRP